MLQHMFIHVAFPQRVLHEEKLFTHRSTQPSLYLLRAIHLTGLEPPAGKWGKFTVDNNQV